MPLAFTQEDFLVRNEINHSNILKLILLCIYFKVIQEGKHMNCWMLRQQFLIDYCVTGLGDSYAFSKNRLVSL